ncbi:cyclophilin-like fold protein [Herbiconiux sp.]|uniref:cyclophilin-like fold protein n=1 Tax=Herbiconiux sp. TaxID=1871186 RepID=UPI0025B95310|nr:cyclophilin-like fold protein [Herbiconiux sp.]
MSETASGRALTRAAAVLLTASLLGVAGCAADPAPTAPAPTTRPTASASPAAPAAPATPSTPVAAPTAAPAPETQEPPVTTDITIRITVNGTTVDGVLQSSAASASLLAQLPLELSFEDFGGQEKIARLPEPLVLDGLPTGGGAEPGTIGYYAPDQALVLYYEAVGHYEGIIPLGHFDEVEAVREAPAFVGAVTAGAPLVGGAE